METAERRLNLKKDTAYELNSMAKNWINGEWVGAEQSAISYNPATGEQIGSYADGGRKEAQKAVEAAVKAFRETSWKSDYTLRSRVLLALADLIEEESAVLTQILCTESGKIMSEATMEVMAAPALLRYWAGKTFTSGRSGEPKPGSISITVREAVGVAGIIVPFNAPVALFIRALAPALAAGTAVVVKLPGLTAHYFRNTWFAKRHHKCDYRKRQ
jgi:betaine-aldehyde dehydrogenase